MNSKLLNSLKRIFAFQLVVSLGALIISCNGHPSQPEPSLPTVTPDQDMILPVAVGNQWVYIDSSTTIYSTPKRETSLTVSIDTVKIISSWTNGKATFYTLNGVYFPMPWLSGPEGFTERNDSLFIITQYISGDSLVLGLWLFPPPPQGQTVLSYGGFTYLASTINTVLNTPVGTFNRYFLYVDAYPSDSIYVVPNVGIVRRSNTMGYANPFQVYRIVNVSVLISYKVAQK